MFLHWKIIHSLSIISKELTNKRSIILFVIKNDKSVIYFQACQKNVKDIKTKIFTFNLLLKKIKNYDYSMYIVRFHIFISAKWFHVQSFQWWTFSWHKKLLLFHQTHHLLGFKNICRRSYISPLLHYVTYGSISLKKILLAIRWSLLIRVFFQFFYYHRLKFATTYVTVP